MNKRQLRKAIETRLWLLIENAGRENYENTEGALQATTFDVMELCRKNTNALQEREKP